MKRIFVALLALLVLLPVVACAQEKIKGKYEVIGSLDKLKGAKQIEMIEFFNYSCGHCYKFLDAAKRLRAKYKDKLHHKKYPVYWGGQTAYPAMAFYIADEQGVEEPFTQEMFDTNFKMQINVFQPKVIKFLARKFHIEKAMTEGMQSEQINDKVKQSLEFAKQYDANETPTVIINKVLKVTPRIAGGDIEKMEKDLEVIFDDILGK